MPLGDFSGRHDAPKEDDIDGAQDPPIAADRNRDRADVGIGLPDRSCIAPAAEILDQRRDRFRPVRLCPRQGIDELQHHRARAWIGPGQRGPPKRASSIVRRRPTMAR